MVSLCFWSLEPQVISTKMIDEMKRQIASLDYKKTHEIKKTRTVNLTTEQFKYFFYKILCLQLTKWHQERGFVDTYLRGEPPLEKSEELN